MTGAERWGLVAVLVLLGAGWGITQPLAKIAVTSGYSHFGLVFWQLALGAVLLGALNLARGKGLPFAPRHQRLYVIIALIGTILPNSASYQAVGHLPAGVLSILVSLVPMFAFPIALAIGIDRFSPLRFAGLVAGLAGVVLIVAPESSLPDPAMILWVPVALIAPFFYAIEGNYVARKGTEGLDAIQTLLGASVVGTVLALPLAVGTGQWIDPRPPWGLRDLAVLGIGAIHAAVYATYVWLVGRAGSVFAAQTAYLVTLWGILWAKLLLGEAYSGWVWAALALMLTGLFLVQPRPRGVLAPVVPLPDTAPRR
ncbi:DMT family transporter [Rhodosalinus sp.]|uniref:DMT family transporter n=1 Tax=Rhodosalinus sp. TaxID=2047741 RepID=UPI00397CD012